jgi:hypothetical protein
MDKEHHPAFNGILIGKHLDLEERVLGPNNRTGKTEGEKKEGKKSDGR